METEKASDQDLIDYVMDSLRRGSATRSFDPADYELVATPEFNLPALRLALSKLRSTTRSPDSTE